MAPSDKHANEEHREEAALDPSRRAALRRLGRFAAVTPPVVTLLMTARPKHAAAASAQASSRCFKQPVAVAQLQART